MVGSIGCVWYEVLEFEKRFLVQETRKIQKDFSLERYILSKLFFELAKALEL